LYYIILMSLYYSYLSYVVVKIFVNCEQCVKFWLMASVMIMNETFILFDFIHR